MIYSTSFGRKPNLIVFGIKLIHHITWITYLTKVFEYSIMSIVMNRFPQEVIGNVVRLRKRGRSLSEISFITGVSKNTLYHWVSNITLTGSQKARLRKKEIRCGKMGLRKARRIQQAKIFKWKEGLLSHTERYKGMVDKKSRFAKLLCGVLYLCEGAKYPASKQMIFGSSDPRLIKTFLCLLRNNFIIDEKKIRCRIMHRWDQDGKGLNKYWAHITRVSLRQFYKSYKDKRTKGSTTKKPGYKGVCAVQYNSTNLQYELQLIGESLYSMND